MSKPIIVVQGGQYGSESKGMVASAIGKRRHVDWAVRTGSINAGHTVYYKGSVFKMQQLPCGWTNPRTKLVIGPGAYIHYQTLAREIDELSNAGVDLRGRIFVDRNCGVHREVHTTQALMAGRHLSIGATGKGCAEAIIDKIHNRNTGYELVNPVLMPHIVDVQDTSALLNCAYDAGDQILIEGTQGTHLDMHHGPYPFVTSRMTTSANWLAEAGLSPSLDYEVVLVLRTFPIRVAGNSGPMPREMSWPQLMRITNFVPEDSIQAFEGEVRNQSVSVPPGSDGLDQHRWTPEQRSEYRQALSSVYSRALKMLRESSPHHYASIVNFMEMTTVTKKPRRIAEFDMETARKAVQLERPAYIALTFINYLYPGVYCFTEDHFSEVDAACHENLRACVAQLERDLETPVGYISTGPYDENLIRWSDVAVE